jgi:maltose alpha-D-glucosyltransferase/alpha-amylase
MLPVVDEDGAIDAQYVLDNEAGLLDAFDAVRRHRIDASRIRVHGDYHLGQVLHAGRDFVIIDFEGEPSRSPTERRIKRGALTDVAGIVRSFQYAAEAGLRDQQARGLVPPDQYTGLAARGRVWQTWVTIAFIGAYLEAADGHPFVPTDPADTHALLTAYVLDKALYEVRYDLDHRPDWAPIPLRGVASMLQSLES